MASGELRETIEALESSLAEFLRAVDGVSDAQSRQRPGEGRWSALDCAEHLALVEERFLARLGGAPATRDSSGIDRAVESRVAGGMADRTRKAQAPEAVVPTGRFATLEEALGRLQESRRKTIAFAEEQGVALFTLDLEHPRFGPMNGAEFLKLSTFHTRRHAAQVREALASMQ
jgi:uncharacterized damage-inducible protein DinB